MPLLSPSAFLYIVLAVGIGVASFATHAEAFQRLVVAHCNQQRSTTSRKDPLLHSRTRIVQRIIVPILRLPDLDFTRTPYADDSYAPATFRETFLEHGAIVVCACRERANLLAPHLDGIRPPCARGSR
ncbi:hypothetical protein DFP72DRAFT_1077860 [Ephemerocybe angulata]|uniref:Uncharacterized protein n=1 Tax=Ephemerocybe angulata TaxID=980116 RepID=A0A8H6LWW9_9AGAR|nr:hypothetical protein DFP72DRAFT_1077860 [Tulosesus angulatus]